MSKRSLKRPNDPIQLAKLIGDIATGQASEPVVSDKDREAAEAGRLGGMKGGVKRAEALTPVLALVAMNATLVDAPPLIDRVSADPDDDKFLAAAIAADVRIVVSGDQDLLDVSGWRDIKILTPRKFVDRHLLGG